MAAVKERSKQVLVDGIATGKPNKNARAETVEERERRQNRKGVFIVSLASIVGGVYVAIELGATNPLAPLIAMVALLSIGIGGLAALVGSKAQISIKDVGRFTGPTAVLLTVLIILLHAAGLIKIQELIDQASWLLGVLPALA